MENVIAVVSDAVEVVSEAGNCVMVDVVATGDAEIGDNTDLVGA